MARKTKLNDIYFGMVGMGKINDGIPIDLKEYAYPKADCLAKTSHVRPLPKKTGFSMKIGGTQFDVTTHFNTEGRESVLQQFKDLILAKKPSDLQS